MFYLLDLDFLYVNKVGSTIHNCGTIFNYFPKHTHSNADTCNGPFECLAVFVSFYGNKFVFLKLNALLG